MLAAIMDLLIRWRGLLAILIGYFLLPIVIKLEDLVEKAFFKTRVVKELQQTFMELN